MVSTVKGISRFIKSMYNNLLNLYSKRRNQLRGVPRNAKLVLYFITTLFAYAVINFALHTITMLIGITIINYFISKVINLNYLNLNELTMDITKPLLGLITFGFSTMIYLFAPELTILLAIVVLPQILWDFLSKFGAYENALSDKTQQVAYK